VRVHDHPRAVNEIALFAPAVLAAASGGDQVADEIVSRAARSLADTVAAAVGSETEMPVALAGRLLQRPSILRDRAVAAISVTSPTARVQDAAASPLDGALGLGLGELPDRYASLIHHWREGPHR
jgi:N-acetylglucosamine kinase-like BadF-type ATPase